jgi:hypothetical protein
VDERKMEFGYVISFCCDSSLETTHFLFVMALNSQTEQIPKIKVSEDGLVMKQILQPGSGISPCKGDLVTSKKTLFFFFENFNHNCNRFSIYLISRPKCSLFEFTSSLYS